MPLYFLHVYTCSDRTKHLQENMQDESAVNKHEAAKCFECNVYCIFICVYRILGIMKSESWKIGLQVGTVFLTFCCMTFQFNPSSAFRGKSDQNHAMTTRDADDVDDADQTLMIDDRQWMLDAWWLVIDDWCLMRYWLGEWKRKTVGSSSLATILRTTYWGSCTWPVWAPFWLRCVISENPVTAFRPWDYPWWTVVNCSSIGRSRPIGRHVDSFASRI